MAGNANSGNRRQDRPFLEALRMELAAGGEDHKALRQLARRLMAEASKGEAWAIKEIIDRVDGKALQQIESHNVNEYVFAEVPGTATTDEWIQSVRDAVGEVSPARRAN